MTLSFSTTYRKGHLKDKPNYFVEKIWEGLPLKLDCFNCEGQYANQKITRHKGLYYSKYFYEYKNRFGEGWDGAKNPTVIAERFPKLHTIRYDPHNRWKVGMKIHPVINNRTKNRFQFAPVLTLLSKQEIRIVWQTDRSYLPLVFIDNTLFCEGSIQELAINDGFPSIQAFFEWFDKDFTGVILHWTELKY